MRVLTLTAALLLLFILVGTSPAGKREPRRELHHGRQVAFNGLGPERWAQRYRAERALRQRLERKLEARAAAVRRQNLRTLQAVRREDDPAAIVAQLARAFMCVHAGEGAWTAATGNGYWGGLQMDRGFMSAYAPPALIARGYAHVWSPVEQIAVGILGWSLRGRTFAPWPTTGRRCGLL